MPDEKPDVLNYHGPRPREPWGWRKILLVVFAIAALISIGIGIFWPLFIPMRD